MVELLYASPRELNVPSTFFCATNRLANLQVFEDSNVVDRFLRQESSCSDHGQTSVLELFVLNDFELFRIRWLESERIKAEIA